MSEISDDNATETATVEPAVKRQRILTQKGFQNTLLKHTVTVTMLGIDLYNKNTFSAWHVSGYSIE